MNIYLPQTWKWSQDQTRDSRARIFLREISFHCRSRTLKYTQKCFRLRNERRAVSVPIPWKWFFISLLPSISVEMRWMEGKTNRFTSLGRGMKCEREPHPPESIFSSSLVQVFLAFLQWNINVENHLPFFSSSRLGRCGRGYLSTEKKKNLSINNF